MRLISFMLTEAQVRARTKTQTRRLGWRNVKVGDRLRGVLKCQGRSRWCPECRGAGVVWDVDPIDGAAAIPCITCDGRKKVVDPLVDLAIVEVTAVRRERLDAITPGDVIAEGFPEMAREDSGADFVEMFCGHMGCSPDTEVTVITFKYVEVPHGQ